MKNPLVSVICLCYNQARFVRDTLDSVIGQTYTNLEIVVVDDASTDQSKQVIKDWLKPYPSIAFINLKENLGNTTAFNKGLALARGKYVIDLACDDVMLPNRVEKQVAFFEKQEEGVGVIYSNAQYINEKREKLNIHFEGIKLTPFEGDIYKNLIETYFIPPPTMMMRKEVLGELNGYDESLVYEDFDFWIRSARNWHYQYQPEILTEIRLVNHSHSKGYDLRRDKKMYSTLAICRKIKNLNTTRAENSALVNRLKYEIRQAFFVGKKGELKGFFGLWEEIDRIPTMHIIIRCIGELGISFRILKNIIQYLRKLI